jgi:membrane protein DedA with SNARE-associated domain
MGDPTNETVGFLVRHGYGVVFASVLVEQLGLPLPAIPVLLAAGALAGSGKLSLSLILTLAVAAALIGDTVWYEIGRRRGARVLGLLCRISLEPDSCVRRTETTFAGHGSKSLLVAKFVPGLSTVAPPLAGVFQMRFPRFLLFDSAGTLLWAGVFIGLGYVFSHQIEGISDRAAALGGWLLVLLAAGLAAFLGWKYFERRRFLHELHVARITPEELRAKLDGGEEVVIVDLRHSLDLDADPVVIPGAQHLLLEEFEQHHHTIPRDREIVLYCT